MKALRTPSVALFLLALGGMGAALWNLAPPAKKPERVPVPATAEGSPLPSNLAAGGAGRPTAPSVQDNTPLSRREDRKTVCDPIKLSPEEKAALNRQLEIVAAFMYELERQNRQPVERQETEARISERVNISPFTDAQLDQLATRLSQCAYSFPEGSAAARRFREWTDAFNRELRQYPRKIARRGTDKVTGSVSYEMINLTEGTEVIWGKDGSMTPTGRVSTESYPSNARFKHLFP